MNGSKSTKRVIEEFHSTLQASRQKLSARELEAKLIKVYEQGSLNETYMKKGNESKRRRNDSGTVLSTNSVGSTKKKIRMQVVVEKFSTYSRKHIWKYLNSGLKE